MTDNFSPALVWAMIIIIGIATFALRYVPIALLSKVQLPDWLKRALVYVPPAVMTAIITPPLFFPGGTPTITYDMPRLLAAGFAALIAWRTRSVLWTVVLGMLALWALKTLQTFHTVVH